MYSGESEPSPAPLKCGDAACLTSCHRAFVSNSCHFSERPQNHFRWRSRHPPGSVGHSWPFRHCDSEHRLSLLSSLYGGAADENRCRTDSLTTNANQCRRALVRFVWRVFRFCEFPTAVATRPQIAGPKLHALTPVLLRSADARLRSAAIRAKLVAWPGVAS